MMDLPQSVLWLGAGLVLMLLDLKLQENLIVPIFQSARICRLMWLRMKFKWKLILR